MKLYIIKKVLLHNQLSYPPYNVAFSIGELPTDGLQRYIVREKKKYISPFEVKGKQYCQYLFKNPNTREYYDDDNIDELFNVFLSNGYSINMDYICKNPQFMKNVLCFIEKK